MLLIEFFLLLSLKGSSSYIYMCMTVTYLLGWIVGISGVTHRVC